MMKNRTVKNRRILFSLMMILLLSIKAFSSTFRLDSDDYDFYSIKEIFEEHILVEVIEEDDDMRFISKEFLEKTIGKKKARKKFFFGKKVSNIDFSDRVFVAIYWDSLDIPDKTRLYYNRMSIAAGIKFLGLLNSTDDIDFSHIWFWKGSGSFKDHIKRKNIYIAFASNYDDFRTLLFNNKKMTKDIVAISSEEHIGFRNIKDYKSTVFWEMIRMLDFKEAQWGWGELETKFEKTVFLPVYLYWRKYVHGFDRLFNKYVVPRILEYGLTDFDEGKMSSKAIVPTFAWLVMMSHRNFDENLFYKSLDSE